VFVLCIAPVKELTGFFIFVPHLLISFLPIAKIEIKSIPYFRICLVLIPSHVINWLLTYNSSKEHLPIPTAVESS
jgi:hypothetical protein